jgi:hypothetical protein
VVENQNWMDMNVYVLTHAGVRFRVGTVNTGSTEAFTVAMDRIGPGGVRLLGDPIGGAELHRTDLLFVGSGSTAFWRIGAGPATSYALVR